MKNMKKLLVTSYNGMINRNRIVARFSMMSCFATIVRNATSVPMATIFWFTIEITVENPQSCGMPQSFGTPQCLGIPQFHNRSDCHYGWARF